MINSKGAMTGSNLLTEEIRILEVKSLTSEILEKTILPGNGEYLLKFLSVDCKVLPFEDFKVYKTKNYKAFSRLAANRDIDEKHVHTLMESFKKDGYLFTILYVNENMELIDGQHRFEAASRMNLPVYFIVMPGWGIREVAILNVNSRNWTIEDFLNTHARGGNMNYVLFQKFYEQYNFNVTTVQLILFGRRTKHGKDSDEFRSGKMEVTNSQIEAGHKKARKILELKNFHPHGYSSRNFVEACLRLFNIKGYDQGHLLGQFKKFPSSILMEANSLRTEEYLKIFEEKYNYRKREKIEIE